MVQEWWMWFWGPDFGVVAGMAWSIAFVVLVATRFVMWVTSIDMACRP